MNYLIKGKDEYAIKAKIKEILNAYKTSTADIVEFDGSDNDFDMGDLLEECNTMSFFADHKFVLYRDPSFLENEEMAAKTIENFFNYLDNPNPNVDLIMYSTSLALKNFKKYSKKLNNNCRVISFDALTHDKYVSLGYALINQAQIKLNSTIAKKLIDYAHGDLFLLKQNINILKTYGENVDEAALNALIDVPFEENTFNLTNAIFAKDMKQALTVLNGFFANNVSVQYLVACIAGQLRFLNEISYLNSLHLTIGQMAEITGSKDFRIVKTIETINRFKGTDFLKLLSDLSDLDQELKSNSNLDSKLRLELFIVNVTRR